MTRFENDETKSLPLVTELGEGTYYWCQCGKTRTVPYCDGSHQGTGITPLAFEIKEVSHLTVSVRVSPAHEAITDHADAKGLSSHCLRTSVQRGKLLCEPCPIQNHVAVDVNNVVCNSH